ncbi:hypothetical protein J5N97_027990 [Dioscorea zingiberensis]|uniref:Serine/threonine-protein kinase ATM n=1 Tax=Dioscorea zingiberensis TaxID=325984 RepID=A0A9D5H4E7_9LILI|nr:hypothetical protein J5N97_027990 [Dioscorea zingiberensis]
MASSRDVQEIISKLSSDKAKSRDEGVRLLSSWLEGERLIGFCKLLGRNTSKIKPDEIPHAETWPFLLKLLMQCIKMEISASKKKQPKLLYAKTLRIAIQCAEDPKLSGKVLSLFHVVKVLFSHILDVLKDVPTFQTEYNIILRHLLSVNEYRYQMRNRVYCSLVNLYMKKVSVSVGGKPTAQSGSKEETFRCVLMLHVLLENSPGDFPDNIREDLIDGFIGIFSHVRDEGKISRKLMDCVNAYLLKDGPNLGCRAMDIHSALQEFLFSCWLTTHDRGLKSSFILYATIQLKLRRSILDETELIEQLLDVISKELDYSSSVSSSTIPWTDISKDEKIGNLGSQQGLMELAAAVFYQACMVCTKVSCQGKRLKMEDAATRVKDGLMKGSSVWTAAFYFLVHSYSLRLDKSLLTYWFQGACEVLQRILNDSKTMYSHDNLSWFLRALQELLYVLCPSSDKSLPRHARFTSGEAKKIQNGWHVVWSCLMHGLPMFSKVPSVADAALRLLGDMILAEQMGAFVVPQDVWNLRIFNHFPSLSALYFVACYFSKSGVQGDLQNVLYLRKSLLRAILDLVNFKEPASLNEQSVMLIPASLFSLCAGRTPFLTYIRKMSFFPETGDKWCKMEAINEGLLDETLECSIEALAEIKSEPTIQVQSEHHRNVRLPRQIWQPLVSEMEEFIVGLLASNSDIEKIDLSYLMHICSFFCNCIYGSFVTSVRGENSSIFSEVPQYIIKLLDHITSIIEEKYNEIHHNRCLGLSSIFDAVGLSLSSLQGFLSCPLFPHCRDKNTVNYNLLGGLHQTIEKLLLAITKLFPDLSRIQMSDSSLSTLPSSPNCYSTGEPSAQIIDMELDVADDLKDVDALAGRSGDNSIISPSPRQLRIEIVKACSYFFPVLPIFTWEVLLDLLRKENDDEVAKYILLNLCKYFLRSAGSLSNLVNLMNKMIDNSLSLGHCYASVISSLCALLGSLTPSDSRDKQCIDEVVNNDEYFKPLGCLMIKIAELDLPDWSSRIKIINCLCSFILLEPCIAQTMVERLIGMLQDRDYRVRLFLARRIQVLFQTWDGHDVLFHDICSNFGFEMVMASKGKLVKVGEVVATCNLSLPAMETALITLAHVALASEDVEIEAVFIICVVAAVDSYHRKLAYALIDNLSRQLQYASRTKYLEELIGQILFHWAACEISLMALVEIQDLFMVNSEAKYFMRFCCPWLLPALILSSKITELNLVAKVTCQPLLVLVKEYFVPIFAVCIALHSSEHPEKEMGGIALHNSILQIGKLSELERDELIKKHMVSIVSFLLSNASSSVDPSIPLFSKEIIALSIRTVVDGFLEMDDHDTKEGIVDKVNIFRPDRVFKFLVEIHYQVSSAVHPRHKRHKLSAIEVLIDIIGYRAAISSTSTYIFSIVGHFISNRSLENQCCGIISTLLDAFRINPTKEKFNILGEQLQFLVSKLVGCCIPSETQATNVFSPKVISLLHQLTVDADPSLYDYIRELELFPELDSFARIRTFHEKLCEVYSPRDHFLKFIRRCSYLPQGLFLWSLRNLHKKLLMGEIIRRENNDILKLKTCDHWSADPEVVCAVWSLVRLCGSNVTNDLCALLADFISRVGIVDPYDVIFHLPGDPSQKHLSQPSYNDTSKDVNLHCESGVTDEILVDILRLLIKYLFDESVKIVDMASQTLQGILSTERGQGALLSLTSHEKSLIEVHSKGVHLELVEKLLEDSEKKSMGTISLEDSFLWRIETKTYEEWICPLVHSLISHSDDIILRLCQDMVLLKAEVAELIFPNVLMNLAGRVDSNVDICDLISVKVQENVFLESNDQIKSIHIILEALNKLRSFYIIARQYSFLPPVKQGRSSRYTKAYCTPEKTKEHSLNVFLSTKLWKKVYWLSIDYLAVSRAAIRTGSYFTAVMYVEHWCEENFNGLTLGNPDFSHSEMLLPHIELLLAAFTHINEPDSIYGIIQSQKLTSQIVTYEHEGNWSKALECYDLLVRTAGMGDTNSSLGEGTSDAYHIFSGDKKMGSWKPHKGLMRSLNKIGCSHVLDVYCQGLQSQKGQFQHDLEFTELQYEAAWRAGNWDFSLLSAEDNSRHCLRGEHFNENLFSCLRALQEGDSSEFHMNLMNTKKELVLSISSTSQESTEYIFSSIVKLQILYHLGIAWDLRWKHEPGEKYSYFKLSKISPEPVIPTKNQLESLNIQWSFIRTQAQQNMNLLEPFIAFRRSLLRVLDCKECILEHLLESACTLRKGSQFSLAAAALHELKLLFCQSEKLTTSHSYLLGRLEEAKVLRAQGQNEMAISLGRYIIQNYQMEEEASNVHRLVGKWLSETRSCNSRTILEQYLKHAVELTEQSNSRDKKSLSRQCQTYFHLAHYTDGLFKSYEERLASSEWQAALRLRKHKTKELDALIRRLRSSTKGEKADYSIKIQELQKQLTMDREEAEKLQDDRDKFLTLALEAYQRCIVIGGKYDLRVVFRLVSLWFSLSSRQNVVKAMLNTVKEVQSFKFIPLVYQIASRLSIPKNSQGSNSFQVALVSLVKKMSIDHPYHTIFQLLALANGDRIKDKQRSRNSFVVDMDKKQAAEDLLNELSLHHGRVIQQMRQMVEIYIRLAELETKKEDTNKKMPLPRDIRSIRQLELVPVVTANVPIDPSCNYGEGSFPHFKGITESITVMNGINAPKLVECFGSDGHRYRQLAKSGNDDLRQDAVMEQFFGLVNTFLENHRDTWKRRLRIRTYKVVPFTPSAGVLEWVNGTIPLGEYLLGNTRIGGAHARYGVGDWTFPQCREYMANEKDKRNAFLKVCDNFRPVMHYFFLEKFLQPADWFEGRLAYTRSVAASSMVGYIVGLGDRHSMNILIDQATAEVVHIDLGVAFEQGLMLKTPERVPFRLTRDVIDGMGITGVEGVFRRCCEETLSVMRTNKEALLTIIEVFIHDPLYKWALSPLKALQRQKETDDDLGSSLESSQDAYEGNKDAARASLRIKQKLDGYEEGELRSVQGQVQQLIQDAIDVDRLCQMFPGWGAWL